jgi:hypothetical protein
MTKQGIVMRCASHLAESMTSCQRFALAVLAASLTAAAYSARAQATGARPAAEACFEFILPQRYMQLTSPLLFDRCTGATWVLVKSGNRSVYRWVSLEIDDPITTSSGIAGVPRLQDKPIMPNAKCFEFIGRHFCE